MKSIKVTATASVGAYKYMHVVFRREAMWRRNELKLLFDPCYKMNFGETGNMRPFFTSKLRLKAVDTGIWINC